MSREVPTLWSALCFATPVDPACAAGVIFFNNVGYLGMCGHGTIGLVATLAHLKRIGSGEHKIETPVGTVSAVLHEGGEVTVNNVASYRSAANVAVDVPGYGEVRGDVAWGGNWFFLVRSHSMELTLQNIDELTSFTWAIRQALRDHGIAGADGKEIDHVELYGPSQLPGVDSKNFVLCPGQSLRSFSLRHRDQRETGMPLFGRQNPRRANLETGKHRGQRLRRQCQGARRQGVSQHQGFSIRERRDRTGAGSSRPVMHGNSRMSISSMTIQV